MLFRSKFVILVGTESTLVMERKSLRLMLSLSGLSTVKLKNTFGIKRIHVKFHGLLSSERSTRKVLLRKLANAELANNKKLPELLLVHPSNLSKRREISNLNKERVIVKQL